jgi:hypothetical protein
MSEASMSIEPSCLSLLVFKGDDLDPAKLFGFFSMKPVRPKKKGDPLGSRPGYPSALAPSGYCGFSTSRNVHSENINDHVSFLLEAISLNLHDIKEIIRADHLSWKIVCFFETPKILQTLLSDNNVIKSKEIGIDIVSDDSSQAVTFVWDVPNPKDVQ